LVGVVAGRYFTNDGIGVVASALKVSAEAWSSTSL